MYTNSNIYQACRTRVYNRMKQYAIARGRSLYDYSVFDWSVMNWYADLMAARFTRLYGRQRIIERAGSVIVIRPVLVSA